MTQHDPPIIAAGLSRIRKKRWFLWLVLLTYLPAIWVALRWERSSIALPLVLGLWLALAAASGVVVAFSRCPRCGNHYHIRGFLPVGARRCLHCGLSIRADKGAFGMEV